MRLYPKSASSERRIRFGIDLMRRLDQFPETRPFKEDLALAQGRLTEAFTSRRSLDVEHLERRCDVSVQELHVDRQIRQFAHIVRAVGNGQKSALYRGLFPAGLKAVVTPGAVKQLEPLAALILRLQEHAGAEELRLGWLTPLIERHERFKSAVASLSRTRAELREAFELERAAREEHRAAVRRVEGGLRRLYAGDPTMLRFFQPSIGLPAAEPKAAPERLLEVGAA